MFRIRNNLSLICSQRVSSVVRRSQDNCLSSSTIIYKINNHNVASIYLPQSCRRWLSSESSTTTGNTSKNDNKNNNGDKKKRGSSSWTRKDAPVTSTSTDGAIPNLLKEMSSVSNNKNKKKGGKYFSRERKNHNNKQHPGDGGGARSSNYNNNNNKNSRQQQQQQNNHKSVRKNSNNRNQSFQSNKKKMTTSQSTSPSKTNSIDSLESAFMNFIQQDRQRREQSQLKQRNRTPANNGNEGQQQEQNRRNNNLPSWLSGVQQPYQRHSHQNENNNNHYRRNDYNGYNNNNNNNKIPLNRYEQQKLNEQLRRKAFHETKADYDRQSASGEANNTRGFQQRNKHRRNIVPLKDNKDREIILPSSSLVSHGKIDVRTLAGVLRVQIKVITNTLIDLGELDESILHASTGEDDGEEGNNSNNIKKKSKKRMMNKNNNHNKKRESLVSVGDRLIDLNIAELVAMELGFQNISREECEFTSNQTEDGSMIGRQPILEEEAEYSTDSDTDDEESLQKSETSVVNYVARPPVVSIMGHVDHGKTTLMDALRRRSNLLLASSKSKSSANKKSKKKKKKKGGGKNKNKAGEDDDHENVAGTEAGGITQIITAFQVSLSEDGIGGGEEQEGGKVTFLDTPGHAAFKAMRQSGSNATDIIVLVIAADDGVSAQTVEILDMYKKIEKESDGNISLLIALNKIDKHGIDVDEATLRIESELIQHDILPEQVQLVPVSGLTGLGLEDLIEALVLQAQLMDLKADQNAQGEGVIMDSRTEKGFGPVVSCVVRWGKMKKGDYVVSGTNMGKIRILRDVNSKQINEALPSQPVSIVGLKTLPQAGDPIICVDSEERAKEIIDLRMTAALSSSSQDKGGFTTHRAEDLRELDLQVIGSNAKQLSSVQKVYDRYGLDVDSIHSNNNSSSEENNNDEPIRIPIIIKADADGTLHAVRESVLDIAKNCDKYNLVIDPIELGIGVPTLSDILLAKESQATIFTFGLRGIDRKLAEENDVQVRTHDIIYSLLDDAKDIFADYLPYEDTEKVHGAATVQAVFTLNNKKEEKIAGLRVTNGTLFKEKCDEAGHACLFRVKRNGEYVEEKGTRANSLRKSKEDAFTVRKGEECGLGLASFDDILEGDTIECFSVIPQKVSL